VSSSPPAAPSVSKNLPHMGPDSDPPRSSLIDSICGGQQSHRGFVVEGKYTVDAHLLERGVSELEHVDDADESTVLHNGQVEVVAICERVNQQRKSASLSKYHCSVAAPRRC
jgi:hypothetical protein